MDNLNDIQDASLTQSVALTFPNLIIFHPELFFLPEEAIISMMSAYFV